MRCHFGKELETYEHFMQCDQYREIDRLMVRDQDLPLLRRGAKGRREVEREIGREGHRKGMLHMVIVKSLWWGLQEHTVAPDVMAYRLLRGAVKHLQERMTCREAQLEARAEDMRDLVTKRIEMGLIRYSPHVNTMVVRPQTGLAVAADRGRGARGGTSAG